MSVVSLPGHEESNYFNIQRALLESLPIPAENIHRICGESEPSVESARYEKDYSRSPDVLRNEEAEIIRLGILWG